MYCFTRMTLEARTRLLPTNAVTASAHLVMAQTLGSATTGNAVAAVKSTTCTRVFPSIS